MPHSTSQFEGAEIIIHTDGHFACQLLVIEALSGSPNEDYRDVADILQSRLYYNAETLNKVIEVVHDFKGQSKRSVIKHLAWQLQLTAFFTFRFLDAMIHLSYTLFRML